MTGRGRNANILGDWNPFIDYLLETGPIAQAGIAGPHGTALNA